MGNSRNPLSLIALALTIQSILGAPATESGTNNPVRGINFDSTGSYVIFSNLSTEKGKCTHTVTVKGEGVYDVFKLSSCKNNNAVTSLGTDMFALYRNPKERLSFFTNSPSTLIVVKGTKCTQRTYTTSGEKTTYKEAPLNNKNCKKAVQDMENAEKQWEKEFEEHMKKAFPPCFPFCGK